MSQAWSAASAAVTAVSGSVTFGYDSNFRISSEQVNGANAVSRVYDADGVLQQVGDLVFTLDPAIARVTGSSLGVVSDSYTCSA